MSIFKKYLFFGISLFIVHSSATAYEFHLVTGANAWRPELDILEQSAIRCGFTLEVLGMHKPWEDQGTKFVWMREYVSHLPDEDIVLFLDAYDVIIIGERETFLKKFLEQGVPLIVSAERNLWPVRVKDNIKGPYPASNTSFRYVNSGGYIGRAGFLKKMFEEMDFVSGDFNDQEPLHYYFLEHQKEILLDRDAEFFLSLYKVDMNELVVDQTKKTVYMKETKNFPLSVHGNGDLGKPLYYNIARLFNLF